MSEQDSQPDAVALVTEAAIEANIVNVGYVSGAQVLFGEQHSVPTDLYDATRTLTLCILVLRSGWTVVGQSKAASVEGFDEEIGKRLAYDDAVRQLKPLMGYAVHEQVVTQSEGAALDAAPSAQ